MKYKTLVTGKNATVIDDFFIQMDDHFEVVSTSLRFNDIVRHLKYFSPDIFVYCLSNESRENIAQMVNIRNGLLRARIPVIVIGAGEECDDFERIAVNVADLVLVKPFTAASLQEDILQFMKEREEESPVSAVSAVTEKIHEKVQEKIQEKEEILQEKVPVIKEKIKEKAKEIVERKPQAPEPKPVPPKTGLKAPAQDAVAEPAQKESAPAPEQTAETRPHILVVDDAPLMLKMLKQHLHAHYDVATAVSGKIAMKFLERRKTDLILLDYEMPGETGPEVLAKLRANDATKDIPVVFLTGVSEREKIQEALEMRPQGYLLKPIDHEKLLDTIKKIVG